MGPTLSATTTQTCSQLPTLILCKWSCLPEQALVLTQSKNRERSTRRPLWMLLHQEWIVSWLPCAVLVPTKAHTKSPCSTTLKEREEVLLRCPPQKNSAHAWTTWAPARQIMLSFPFSKVSTDACSDLSPLQEPRPCTRLTSQLSTGPLQSTLATSTHLRTTWSTTVLKMQHPWLMYAPKLNNGGRKRALKLSLSPLSQFSVKVEIISCHQSLDRVCVLSPRSS